MIAGGVAVAVVADCGWLGRWLVQPRLALRTT